MFVRPATFLSTIQNDIGLTWGYSLGGGVGTPDYDDVLRFSFVTDGNATDIASLSEILQAGADYQNRAKAYYAGGLNNGITWQTDIERFDLPGMTSRTTPSSLRVAMDFILGASSPGNKGYTFGYRTTGGGLNSNIEKYDMGTEATSTSTGTNTVSAPRAMCSSVTHAYGAANVATSKQNSSEKMAYATDTTSATVGTLTTAATEAMSAAGNSSLAAFWAGGINVASGRLNVIQKVTFATDAATTNVGTLNNSLQGGGGCSSLDHFYVMGGQTGASTYIDVIEKMDYATEGTATDVGNLTTTRALVTGFNW